ncbi:MAG: PAS domain S-box protein [Gemmatimonadota bacterium]
MPDKGAEPRTDSTGNGPIRVLLVDDDQGDFEMTRAMMAEIETRRIDLDWVSTFEEGLDALEQNAHDVYLVDYYLEDHTGMDLLREARKRALHAPLIMLTGRGNREVDLEAMKAGAADYLVKGRIDPERLERSIRFALERSRAEAALRQSEKRHRGMFDHLPVGLYRCHPDGSFIDANPALVRLVGYPSRQILQDRYARDFYVNPADRDRFWEILESQGIVRGFESWIDAFDGSRIRVRNTARVHRDAEGVIEYVEGTVEDVTRENRIESLQESESRFRAMFEESGSPVAVVDLDGLIIEVNPAFHGVFGIHPGDAPGASFVDLAVPEERAELLRTMRLLSRAEPDRTVGENRFRADDGTVIWTRTKMRAIRDREGRPDHLVVLFEEISEEATGGE